MAPARRIDSIPENPCGQTRPRGGARRRQDLRTENVADIEAFKGLLRTLWKRAAKRCVGRVVARLRFMSF
jgi:hypothetical protein